MIQTAPLLALALAVAAPAGPSQTATTTPVLPPDYEHVHEGELGEKLMHLEGQIRCNCGCSLDTHMCQYQMQCGTSPGFTHRILTELEEGATEEAVLAGFVSQYGQSILMAPPAEGFNLLGYLLPPAALLMGGVLVGMFLRGRRPEPGPAGVNRAPLDPDDWVRLQDELAELEPDDDW